MKLERAQLIELARRSEDGHLDDPKEGPPQIIYLPYDYVFPGGRFVVQFYWDSYFIIASLLKHGRAELAVGMAENMFYLIDRYGMVLANRKRWSAGSQLPFLAMIACAIYDILGDKSWLTKAARFAEIEYENYWCNQDHLAYGGLSRYHVPSYYPTSKIASITVDTEATWDLSPRFTVDNVLSILPLDLNCNLYQYEVDLSFFYSELGDLQRAALWAERAERRQRAIDALMWDDQRGMYFDYNFSDRRRSEVASLATFAPLFVGLASRERAERVVANLALFEQVHGLSACDRDYGYVDRQWNYPIGWAPLHWIAFKGLRRYDFDGDAQRVALKWLNLNHAIWVRTGKLFEKYDVVAGSIDVLTDRYSNQEGFGWTNAVFSLLVQEMA